LLDGKYRVDRLIGRGGMGVVMAATHIHLHQPVAIKILHAEAASNPDVVERFVREARASAQLRSEHVCRVSDVGAMEDGSPYLVMELLEGQDLASLVTQYGPVPIPTLVDYLLQACLGVAEAHVIGVVHRDLKPANLFLTRRSDGTGIVKVLDFGIAKAQADTSFHLTQTTTVLGSPGYMSPEQLRSSRDVDVRSDIWALGVVVYELVSGRRPFDGNSITELALKVAMDPPAPLPSNLPRGFADVINRCLEKEPDRRFSNVAAFASALAPFGSPLARDQAAGVARVLNVQQRMQLAPAAGSVGVPPTIGHRDAVRAARCPAAQPAARRPLRLPRSDGTGADDDRLRGQLDHLPSRSCHPQAMGPQHRDRSGDPRRQRDGDRRQPLGLDGGVGAACVGTSATTARRRATAADRRAGRRRGRCRRDPHGHAGCGHRRARRRRCRRAADRCAGEEEEEDQDHQPQPARRGFRWKSALERTGSQPCSSSRPPRRSPPNLPRAVPRRCSSSVAVPS
jgi:serine/threonine-protein kinase